MRENILNAVVCVTRSSLVDDTGAVINVVCVLSTRAIVCAASDCSVVVTPARIPATAVIAKDVGKSVSIFIIICIIILSPFDVLLDK